MKELQPLTHGSILIVGAKASNFPVEITDNVRVALWESQNQHWLSKELPVNTRAIFCTKWMGHDAFVNIMKEARKKRITIFTPQGTGLITKQVKELLNMNGTKEMPITTVKYVAPVVAANPPVSTVTTLNEGPTQSKRGKLNALIPFIDWNLTNVDNSRILLKKAEELGVKTTQHSLENFVGNLRGRNKRQTPLAEVRPALPPKKEFPKYKNDVAVEIFDNILKELKDLRQYLVQTTLENQTLRTRIEKFKNILEID